MPAPPLSHDDVRDLLRLALRAAHPGTDVYTYIRTVYPGEVVYDLEQYNDSATYRRSYVIGEAAAVTLGEPERVRQSTTYEKVAPAQFSLRAEEIAADGTWTGKVFEVGSYPAVGFSLNEAEADAAVASFRPVPVNYEHRSGPFDGRMGRLTALRREGRDLLGTYEIPAPVVSLLGSDAVPVSMEWDIPTKRVVGLALTETPRITDASLRATFSLGDGEPAPRRGAAMDNITEYLRRLIGRSKPEDIIASFSEAPTDPAPTNPAAPDAALVARIQELEAQIAAGGAGRASDAAAQFAESAIAAGVAIPAEKPHLVALFTQAATDDGGGVAKFSADGSLTEGPRVAALRASIAARPKHGLTEERTRADFAVLPGGAPTPAPPALDPQAILAARSAAERGKA